jgi:hypothetical protein
MNKNTKRAAGQPRSTRALRVSLGANAETWEKMSALRARLCVGRRRRRRAK